jgi:hypothetical protein
MQPRCSARQRAQWVARWRASDESQGAFARRHGIHPRTFWGWVQTAPPAAAARFVPVQVTAEPVVLPPTPVEILLPRGTVVRVTPGTSPAWLAAVVAAVHATC